MSTGLHTSLSGNRTRPTVPLQHQNQNQGPLEANLTELGLLGNKHTRKRAKRTVEFTTPGDSTHSHCTYSLRLV
jgi:hypothetical protein